jgi:hypothetical protein
MWCQLAAMLVMGTVCLSIVIWWPQPFTLILGGFGLRNIWQDATALRAEVRQIRERQALIFALTGRRV